jgi:uncharacterized membrane protein YhhN
MAISLSTGLKAVYGALAVVDSVLAGSARPAAHRARRVTKPLLLPTLAASQLSDPRARRSPLLASTLAGEAAGWCGDVALLNDEPVNFAFGATAFAVGHAAYASGLLRLRGGAPGGPAKAIGGLWALSAPGVVLAAGREAPYLVPVLGGYSAMLSGTAAAATMLGDGVPADAKRSLVAGGLCFLVSDAMLGLRRFLWRGAPPVLEAAVMASYSAAQFLIADGAARAG